MSGTQLAMSGASDAVRVSSHFIIYSRRSISISGYEAQPIATGGCLPFGRHWKDLSCLVCVRAGLSSRQQTQSHVHGILVSGNICMRINVLSTMLCRHVAVQVLDLTLDEQQVPQQAWVQPQVSITVCSCMRA